MKRHILFLLFLTICLSGFGTDRTKLFLLSKSEFTYLVENDLLVTETIKYIFGNNNTYSFFIEKADCWNPNTDEFNYYPSKTNNKEKSKFNTSVLNAVNNVGFNLRVTINPEKSKISTDIKPFIDNKNSILFRIVVVGEKRAFVTEAKNKNVFHEMIKDQSFTDKVFNNFFGKQLMKLTYDIHMNNINACFIKDIANDACVDSFLIDTTEVVYKSFSDKLTSEEYSSYFVLFDINLNRAKSRFTKKIEEAIIKYKDGSEHIKFYLCIPKNNQKVNDIKYRTMDGKIINSDKKSLNAVTVYLVDQFNTVVASQKTDKNGYFNFNQLKEGIVYELFIDKSCDEKQITLTTKNDSIIGDFKKTKLGHLYKIFEAEEFTMKEIEVSDDVSISVKGRLVYVTDKINNMEEQDVELWNEHKQLLQKRKTDKDGYFEFNDVDPSENYSIELPNYRELGRNEKLYLANGKNELISQFIKNTLGKYSYRVIAPDMIHLTDMVAEDVELTFKNIKKGNTNNIVIRDFIYYELNSFNLSEAAITKLSEIAKLIVGNEEYKIEIVSHTDARGDSNDNIKLSQKRSEAVLDYFVKQGINKNRLKPIGLGESNPLNSCVDGKVCSEEEYKMNRRTEFKFYK